MASISTDARGNRRILFVDTDGKRKPIRVGKMPMKATEEIKRRVEQLVACKFASLGWDVDLAKWVTESNDELTAKLAAVGLVPKRNRALLGEFVAGYIENRKADLAPGTIVNLQYAEGLLLEFFTANKRLRDITPGDADDFRRFVEGKLGINTARRLLGRCKQFFRAALRKRLIIENPLADMAGLGVTANKAREVFVSPADAAKVLAACPDNEWRLLFALARWGGLRVPSEPLALTWGDVDWERSRLRVTCVKTAHHGHGHAERWIPIFPEIRPYLDIAWAEAPDKATHIIRRYRNTRANLRTQFHRIVEAAGVEKWGKPFQNCRSTRETELAELYPLHIVCTWIGNSQAVAKKHYLQVTDDHFDKAAQKQAHQPAITGPNQSPAADATNMNTPV